MAGEYWLLKNTLGWSIDEQPDEVVRVGLLTFNVLPLILYLWMIGRLAERYGATDWGRLFVVAAAAFGTLLSTFLITFNNHVPAAFATLIALYAALPVAFPPGTGRSRSRLAGTGRLVVAGLAAGFLFNCELPAAAFVAALGLLLLVRAPGRTLLWFAPPRAAPCRGLLPPESPGHRRMAARLRETGHGLVPVSRRRLGTIHPGEGQGIEFAKYTEPRWMYALHLLFGHHGWFSLTPINLLGAAGMVLAARRPGAATCGAGSGAARRGLGRDDRRLAGRLRRRLRLLRLHHPDSQLRRLDERPALAAVADAVVAVRPAAGRRLARPAALGPRPVPGAAGAFRAVGQLLPLEPVAASVALPLVGFTGLAAVLSRCFWYSSRSRRRQMVSPDLLAVDMRAPPV